MLKLYGRNVQLKWSRKFYVARSNLIGIILQNSANDYSRDPYNFTTKLYGGMKVKVQLAYIRLLLRQISV